MVQRIAVAIAGVAGWIAGNIYARIFPSHWWVMYAREIPCDAVLARSADEAWALFCDRNPIRFRVLYTIEQSPPIVAGYIRAHRDREISEVREVCERPVVSGGRFAEKNKQRNE